MPSVLDVKEKYLEKYGSLEGKQLEGSNNIEKPTPAGPGISFSIYRKIKQNAMAKTARKRSLLLNPANNGRPQKESGGAGREVSK